MCRCQIRSHLPTIAKVEEDTSLFSTSISWNLKQSSTVLLYTSLEPPSIEEEEVAAVQERCGQGKAVR
ncbi:hypothetical protein AXF42_Ash020387 [Apostasia shenzhenica]|uniref:Uncharacterized protein n=1 Tax=Apostasia shenzhenica TaxID=1088818 RepID=A0A2I0A3M2_9ASPA|nr:hypothetical protein AXF42_Ash020387 [Apostasia shenzhenica]